MAPDQPSALETMQSQRNAAWSTSTELQLQNIELREQVRTLTAERDTLRDLHKIADGALVTAVQEVRTLREQVGKLARGYAAQIGAGGYYDARLMLDTRDAIMADPALASRVRDAGPAVRAAQASKENQP